MHRAVSCLLVAAMATAAEGNVVVDQTALSATVGTGAVASVFLTVRNTGDASLRMRLRDTGSGTGGTAVPAATLATYSLSSWIDGNNGTGHTINPIAFDGLNLWRLSGTRFVATRLENGDIVRQITSPGSVYAGMPVWDGRSIWLGSSVSLVGTDRTVYQFSTLTSNAGALLRTLTLPDRSATQGWGMAPTYDPLSGQVWGFDATYGVRIDATTGTFTQQTQLQGATYGQTGITWYDGDAWYTRGASDKTRIARRDCLTGTVETTYPVLSAAEVAYNVYGMAADGWGRFIIITATTKQDVKASMVDSGLRGWMTCADAGIAPVVIPAGGQAVFTVRCNAGAAGIGTFNSLVMVDSDDPQTPRVTVPVQFTVENRTADAPVARTDSYATTWDATLSVAAPGVLGNDDAVQPVTAQLVATTTHGVLTLNAGGSFTYDATDGFVGNDTFTYRAIDAQARQSAITTVTIAVDHAPIPEIQLNPTAVTVTAAPGSTTSVDLTVANIGYGTLQASLSDPGTGGAPATRVREASVPTLAFTTTGIQMAMDGNDCWVLDTFNPTQLRRVSLQTGAVLRTVTPALPNLPAQGIAWDGTRLWVAEQAETTNAGGVISYVRDPRVFAINPMTGAVMATVSFPQPGNNRGWVPNLTVDDRGGLWLVCSSIATWRVDTATLVKTSKPTISAYMTAITWYDGSLWIKDRPTINRYNPETGAQISGQSFAWGQTGDYAFYNGFASAGFGRFWIIGGPEGSPVFARVDSGIRGWLRATPASVSVGRQSSTLVRLDLIADLAGPGTRTVNVQIFSNDATDPVVVLPVTFTVGVAANTAPVISLPAQAPATIVLP